MNSHGRNEKNNHEHNHNPLKHMIHMAICCGLPIIIVGILPLISRLSPSAGGFISKIVPFLCPIMMVAMMGMMMGGNRKKSCCDGDKHEDTTNEIV